MLASEQLKVLKGGNIIKNETKINVFCSNSKIAHQLKSLETFMINQTISDKHKNTILLNFSGRIKGQLGKAIETALSSSNILNLLKIDTHMEDLDENGHWTEKFYEDYVKILKKELSDINKANFVIVNGQERVEPFLSNQNFARMIRQFQSKDQKNLSKDY